MEAVLYSIPNRQTYELEVKKELSLFFHNDKLAVDVSLVDDFSVKLVQLRNEALTLFKECNYGAMVEVEEKVKAYLKYVTMFAFKNFDIKDKKLVPSSAESAFTVTWTDSILNQKTHSGGALTEILSILLELVSWRTQIAKKLCASLHQADVETALKAHKLIGKNVSTLLTAKQFLLPHVNYSIGSSDINAEALDALLLLERAELQSIVIYRAIAKKNSTSLIASLALAAHQLYQRACVSAISTMFAMPSSPVIKYAEYRGSVFYVLAMLYTGLNYLECDKAGVAIRLLDDAKQLSVGITRSCQSSFNKLTPSVDHLNHRSLENLCEASYKKAKQANSHIYYHPVPKIAPKLENAKDLSEKIGIEILEIMPGKNFEFEMLASFCDEVNSLPGSRHIKLIEAKSKIISHQNNKQVLNASQSEVLNEKHGSCKFIRWILVVFALPFVFALSLLGGIVWLILFPIKVCCCPLGCLIQVLADLVEYFLKAPFKLLLWASGKPYKHEKSRDEIV